MNARLKLNSAVFQGSLIVAAVVGWAWSSWTVFFMVAVILIAAAFYSGEIRTTSDSKRNNRSRRQ